MWGPCSVVLMLIAGVGLIATAFITKTGDAQTLHYPRLLSAFGWSYLAVGVLITIAVSTGTAFIHHALVARFTFALFRLYAAVVSSGVAAYSGGV